MLIVIHAARPGSVFATHEDEQEARVLAVYPAGRYGVYRVMSSPRPFDPVPLDAVPVRVAPPASP